MTEQAGREAGTVRCIRIRTTVQIRCARGGQDTRLFFRGTWLSGHAPKWGMEAGELKLADAVEIEWNTPSEPEIGAVPIAGHGPLTTVADVERLSAAWERARRIEEEGEAPEDVKEIEMQTSASWRLVETRSRRMRNGAMSRHVELGQTAVIDTDETRSVPAAGGRG